MRALALLLLLACSGNTIGGTGGGSGGGSTGTGGGTAGGTAGGVAGGTGGGTAGGSGGGTIAVFDGGVPTWRVGVPKWQWVELTGATLANQPIANPFDGTMTNPTQRINAWNGLAANRDNNRLYLACAGGHADWAGNEVYEIDLSLDAPRWHVLRNPTDGGYISSNVPYYSDGRPSSTHLYYALHFVRGRNRIFKMSAGSVWGDGNSNNNNVDAFNLATGDWDTMGTWAKASTSGGAIDRPYAQNNANDDIYSFINAAFRRWNASTATWDTLAARPSYANDDIVSASASGVDPTRGKVVFTRNLYRTTQKQGLELTFDGGLSDVTFTGAAADMAISGQGGLQFVPSEDVYLLMTGSGGTVARINPTTYAVTLQPTTGTAPPNAVNGVYTRWQYLPLLKGIAYLPSGSSNFWFLATE